jgi:transposase-like protein
VRMRARRSLGPELKRRHWNAATAEQILATWRRSGQSLVAFARERGIGAQRLYWWRKRLGPDAQETGTSAASLAFIPATVAGTGPAARIALRFPGGLEVEATGAEAVPAEWVASLARALANQS